MHVCSSMRTDTGKVNKTDKITETYRTFFSVTVEETRLLFLTEGKALTNIFVQKVLANLTCINEINLKKHCDAFERLCSPAGIKHSFSPKQKQKKQTFPAY